MIDFTRFTLDNGLKVLVHSDPSSPIVALNLLYDVGAKDEFSDKTGFAHLFEHLMFGGSVNISSYDEPLERVGGENNAFTNNDYTNYYLTLPLPNIETAFWLESDRMLQLDFSKKKLNIQQNVVIEEFKQRYLNQPYGDVWLLLRPLAYKQHPYMWSTIGKDILHIQNANLDDVKDFFYSHYAPNNAIMCVSGNVNVDRIKQLSQKWFGPIEKRDIKKRNLAAEPIQNEERKLTVYRDVPSDAIYKVYHICSRTNPDFYTFDLMSDILSNGDSSRLTQSLIKEKKLFTSIDAYLSNEIDEGLFVISGKVAKGISIEQAEVAIEEEIQNLKDKLVSEKELDKVKNKVESNNLFSNIGVMAKAMNLCYHELIWEAEKLNSEDQCYRMVTAEQIKNAATNFLKNENCSTLYYLSNKHESSTK